MNKIKKNDHFYLIDGSGYIFRAYYALPPLTRKSDGLPTGAVSGFCSMLFKLLEDAKSEDNKNKPTKEQKDLANRRVALGLFFAEEGNRNGISVSEKEYNDAVYREAMNYPGKEQDFIKFLDNNPSIKEQISAPIFENKVFDHIVKLIKKSDKNISFEQFKKKFDANML